MSIAALHGAAPNFAAWHYYAELKHLRRRPVSIAWLEAHIATCGAGLIRPGSTVRSLQRLRNLRTERDEVAEFEAFEALFKSAVPEGSVTNHGFGNKTFADLDHQAMWQVVAAHSDTLRQSGYTTFLNSGTLLGVIRDKKLIDHDDDIDLGLVLKAQTEEEAAVEWRDLYRQLKDEGLHDPDANVNPAIFKLKPMGGCQIDLFPAWVQQGTVYVYPHTRGELRRDQLFPLQTCTVSGLQIPAEPESMLEINYGKGWRDPDPYFKFPWHAARAKFKTFLEAVA